MQILYRKLLVTSSVMQTLFVERKQHQSNVIKHLNSGSSLLIRFGQPLPPVLGAWWKLWCKDKGKAGRTYVRRQQERRKGRSEEVKVQTLNIGVLLERAGCYDGEKRLIYTHDFYHLYTRFVYKWCRPASFEQVRLSVNVCP